MLELKNVSFKFHETVVFDNLNMHIFPGEVTGIVGYNGVGKTTLFRVISGIYQNYEGSIKLNDNELRDQDVGLLSTNPYFYPYMKGREYLEIVLGVGKLSIKVLDLAGIHTSKYI